MSKKNIIQTIREKEMDRKDFLKYSGVILVGLIGLRGIAALLSTPEKVANNLVQKSENHGFGGGKYGE